MVVAEQRRKKAKTRTPTMRMALEVIVEQHNRQQLAATPRLLPRHGLKYSIKSRRKEYKRKEKKVFNTT
jgi:hypothetical protein